MQRRKDGPVAAEKKQEDEKKFDQASTGTFEIVDSPSARRSSPEIKESSEGEVFSWLYKLTKKNTW